MWTLPVTVTVLDREYRIRDNGDYRIIMPIITIHHQIQLSDVDKTISILSLFYNELDEPEDVLQEFETVDYMQEAANQVTKFISCGQDVEQGYHTKYPLIDWVSDEPLIVAGINEQLGKDVREVEYMHWWTFYSYFLNIREGPLATVVSIRDKIVRGKKLDKGEQEFRTQNPQHFNWRERLKTKEEIDFESKIRKEWNK